MASLVALPIPQVSIPAATNLSLCLFFLMGLLVRNVYHEHGNVSCVNIISVFAGYKNRRKHVVSRSAANELQNFRLADSITGIKLVRNMLNGYQRIKNAVIIAESDNIGKMNKYL